MKISVLIPTYRRPKSLRNCLEALKSQSCKAEEVIIVVQEQDEMTWELLREFDADSLNVCTVMITVPGQVAALNLGLEKAIGDVVAITDDDTIPHVDWLKRIRNHFLADETVGGVGGRDWVYHGQILETGEEALVGKLQWFGRSIGNHHLGIGAARDVDILKGANMSYRSKAIAGLKFDSRLKGKGAQVCNDMAFSLLVKRAGWQLIYDPAVAVDHFPAERFDEDGRDSFNPGALINQAHNETLVLLEHLSALQNLFFLAWIFLVGSRANPGFIQTLRLLPTEGRLAIDKFLAVLQGNCQGIQTWSQSSE